MVTRTLLFLLGCWAVQAAHLREKDVEELQRLLQSMDQASKSQQAQEPIEQAHTFLDHYMESEAQVAQAAKKVSTSVKSGAPHVFLFLLDDLGINDVSWNNPEVISPNMQALADEGVILDHNYAQAVCSPSRGSLMFGKYPVNTGMQHDVIMYQAPECANVAETMLPEKLTAEGYRNYLVGKWHLGFCDIECTPLYRGFDEFYGFYQAGISYYDHSVGYYGKKGYDLRDGLDSDVANNGTYATDLFTDRAVSMIENHDEDTPMFMFFSHAAIHTPLEVPSRFTDMYPDEKNPYRKQIKGMITSADESIGTVVQAIKDNGMYDNSVIIISSDNGGQAWMGSNYPLRGSKSSIFEGGTRVPGVFHSPLQSVKGTRSQGMFHITDWHATILSLAGISTDGLDGLDQTNMLMHGEDSVRNEIVYNVDDIYPQYLGAYGIRIGDYKLLQGFPGGYDGWEQHEGLGYTHKFDYIRNEPSFRNGRMINNRLATASSEIDTYISEVADHLQLYNVVEDPSETMNLASSMPEKVAELQARLQELSAGAAEVHLESQIETDDGLPSNFGGFWSSGWCSMH